MPVTILRNTLGTIMLLISLNINAAPLYPEFTVNEGTIPGAVGHQLTANQIDFSYSSTITIQRDGTFTQTGALSVSAFQMVDDVSGSRAVGSQLNLPESLMGGAGYQLGASFTASGQTNSTSNPSGTLGTYDSFSLSMLYDANQDGTYDGLLGTAELNGFSTFFLDLDPLTAGDGDFSVDLDFLPSGMGMSYFTSLNPLYQKMLLTGNTRVAAVKIGPNGEIIYEINGTGNITFYQMPEPASWYLFGLGILALGSVRRYRRQP